MRLVIVLLVLLSFLAGYLLGKYRGEQAGHARGMAEAPLLLRQQTLETGICSLCRQDGVTKESDRAEG